MLWMWGGYSIAGREGWDRGSGWEWGSGGENGVGMNLGWCLPHPIVGYATCMVDVCRCVFVVTSSPTYTKHAKLMFYCTSYNTRHTNSN